MASHYSYKMGPNANRRWKILEARRMDWRLGSAMIESEMTEQDLWETGKIVPQLETVTLDRLEKHEEKVSHRPSKKFVPVHVQTEPVRYGGCKCDPVDSFTFFSKDAPAGIIICSCSTCRTSVRPSAVAFYLPSKEQAFKMHGVKFPDDIREHTPVEIWNESGQPAKQSKLKCGLCSGCETAIVFAGQDLIGIAQNGFASGTQLVEADGYGSNIVQYFTNRNPVEESCVEYFTNLPPWAVLLEITTARQHKTSLSRRSSVMHDGHDFVRQKEFADRLSTLVTPRALSPRFARGQRPWHAKPRLPLSGSLTERSRARTSSGIGTQRNRHSGDHRTSLRTAFEAERYSMTAEERQRDIASFLRSKKLFAGKEHGHGSHHPMLPSHLSSAETVRKEEKSESKVVHEQAVEVAKSKPPPPKGEDLWGFKSKNGSLNQSMSDLTKGQWKSLPGSNSTLERGMSATRPDGEEDTLSPEATGGDYFECVFKARKMHQEAAHDAGKMVGANGKVFDIADMSKYSQPVKFSRARPPSPEEGGRAAKSATSSGRPLSAENVGAEPGNPSDGGVSRSRSLFNPAVKFGTKWRRKALRRVDYVTIDGNDETAYEKVKNGMELLRIASDIVQDGRIQRGLSAHENLDDETRNVLKDTPWSSDFYIDYGSKNPVDIGLRP